MRISKGERHDFGAAAPLPTRASSLKRGRAGSPVKSSPKLVERFGPAWTLFSKPFSHASLELQQRHPPCARESSCLMARIPPWQGVAAECPALDLLSAERSFLNPPYSLKALPIDFDNNTCRNSSHVIITYAS